MMLTLYIIGWVYIVSLLVCLIQLVRTNGPHPDDEIPWAIAIPGLNTLFALVILASWTTSEYR